MRSHGFPEVRITGRCGQRIFTSRARSMPYHHAAKANVREDHGDLTPADQQDCERRFCAFTLDRVEVFIFEQRCRQAAEFSVGLRRSIRLAACVALAP
jgi:hypothetical protein